MKTSILPLTLLVSAACFAQTPGFDVASIRAVDLSQGRVAPGIQVSPGALIMRNQSLLGIVQWAYEAPPFQITSPDWMRDLRFDVTARAANPATEAQLRVMLQGLLGQRFGLKVHREQKEMKVYAMTLGKDGPKFKESLIEGPSEFSGGKGEMIANRATMAEIAAKITEPLQAPVIDETGLKGHYDIRIDVMAYMNENGTDVDPLRVLFNAIPAQLGIKLESKTRPVSLLIVDSMNKAPTEN